MNYDYGFLSGASCATSSVDVAADIERRTRQAAHATAPDVHAHRTRIIQCAASVAPSDVLHDVYSKLALK